MNRQFKNKMSGCGTTVSSDNGIFFSVRMNAIPVVHEVCSAKELSQEQTEVAVQTSIEHPRGINFLRGHFEQQEDGLALRHLISALEKQIADEELELFEEVRQIVQLEAEPEKFCERLFFEVNVR